MKRLFIFIALTVFLLGCDKLLPVKQKPASQEKVSINGILLAQVNDWAIGLDDFTNYLENVRPLAEAQNLDIDSYEFKKTLLNDLIKAQILAQIAEERGIDKEPEVVKALRDYRDSLLALRLRSDLENEIYVSLDEVREFYEQNKQLLRKPQEIKVREIGVDSEARAKQIYIAILQGDSFSSLARQYSVLPSAKDGGDLGYLTYDPEKKFQKFWESVAALEKGDVSSIFNGEDGKYYIIKVEDIRGGQEIPLSEVENDLREGLKKDKVEQRINNLIDNFKVKSKVQIHEELIR